jgi:hypothetical protein
MADLPEGPAEGDPGKQAGGAGDQARLAYSPREIVELLEDPRGLQPHEIALIIASFFPTIKQSLLDYDLATDGRKIIPLKIPLD